MWDGRLPREPLLNLHNERRAAGNKPAGFHIFGAGLTCREHAHVTEEQPTDTARHCASSDPSSGCAAPLSQAWGHTQRHTPAVFVAD
ncbi:hypothetical protein DdX_09082 [Ditylenchus destructor]|uniref:Uncharacterized protein n=1 Tax=Ditylenchus destructor TaxID=166010 RepID=A0AAD4N3F8_9BILA|nr:hypothetical protein DdX_09082 [Ditylenchus destructor]